MNIDKEVFGQLEKAIAKHHGFERVIITEITPMGDSADPLSHHIFKFTFLGITPHGDTEYHMYLTEQDVTQAIQDNPENTDPYEVVATGIDFCAPGQHDHKVNVSDRALGKHPALGAPYEKAEPKCECGADSIDSGIHNPDYCPKGKVTDG